MRVKIAVIRKYIFDNQLCMSITCIVLVALIYKLCHVQVSMYGKFICNINNYILWPLQSLQGNVN